MSELSGGYTDVSRDCVIIIGRFNAYTYETFVGLCTGEPLFTTCTEDEKRLNTVSRKESSFATNCTRYKGNTSKFAGIAVSIFSKPINAYWKPERNGLVSLAVAGKLRAHVRGTSIESHIGTPIYAVSDACGNYLTVDYEEDSVAVGTVLSWCMDDIVDLFLTFNPSV